MRMYVNGAFTVKYFDEVTLNVDRHKNEDDDGESPQLLFRC